MIDRTHIHTHGSSVTRDGERENTIYCYYYYNIIITYWIKTKQKKLLRFIKIIEKNEYW